MKALVQRVSKASVSVEGDEKGAIEHGMLVLLGIHELDNERMAKKLARKCAHFRMFADKDGRMNYSLQDVNGEVLVVPQFTLYGDTESGHRPSFSEPAPPSRAEPLYDRFVLFLETELGRKVETGVFGAMMQVHLTNDGPVTFSLECLPDEQ